MRVKGKQFNLFQLLVQHKQKMIIEEGNIDLAGQGSNLCATGFHSAAIPFEI